MAKIKREKWTDLNDEVGKRFWSGFSRPDFILYFVVVIVLTGFIVVGLTIYVENGLTQSLCCHPFSHLHVILSMSAYSIALLTASAVDLILSSREVQSASLRSSFIMIGVSAVIIGYVLMLCSILIEGCQYLAYVFATLGIILSWFIWWIANYNNINFGGGQGAASIGGEGTRQPGSDPETVSFEVNGDLSHFKS